MEKAIVYNDGKPKWSLVYYPAIEDMIRVLEFGCKKYDKNNWKKPMNREEILESIQRHLAKLFEGEEIDSESLEHHISHIMARCMFYFYHSKNDTFYE